MLDLNFPENLPIVQARAEIAQAITDNQVVIVAGETGSGKTTQLPKICYQLGLSQRGKIVCTQPRRVAAIGLAQRVADELQNNLGDIVGYQVRFAEKFSPQTKIKFVTDGILLAETRRDKMLRQYQTIIIDEAHERTLNIDFLLGFLRRLLPHRRDLKIIISSATLDVQRFSKFFSDAPIIEVSGRNFPVEIIYANDNSDDEDDKEISLLIGNAVRKLWSEITPADTLVFVSGEQDIRETVAHLEGAKLPHTEILPLYGRMSQDQQQRIFYPQNLHRIIVATNVAETSITVPRIRYVIDSGQARIKRYNPRTQIEQLQIERISRASANQRAGRCGRISAGICVRLYSENDFNTSEEFTPPEICRSSLASVILQMNLLQLGRVEDFPFIEPPARALIKSGYEELFELGALDEHKKITARGTQLAQLPLEPRYGQMLLSGVQNNVREEILTIVAVLEIPDPRLRPLEQQDRADTAHKKYVDNTSDFSTYLRLWEDVEKKRATLSNNKFHEFCRENFLSWRRLKEWREVRAQLTDLINDNAPIKMPAPKNKSSLTPHELLHHAILSGLLSKCGYYHDEEKIYRGARESRFVIFPGSSLVNTKPAWIMSAEIVETSRVFARTTAIINVEWLEALAKNLLKYHYHAPFFDEEFGCVRARCNATLYGMPIVQNRLTQYGNIAPSEARKIFITDGLVNLRLRCNLDFHQQNKRLINTLRDREEKLRRRDLLISNEAMFNFYDARLPAEINTVNLLERWILDEKKAGCFPLTLCESDIILEQDNGLSADLFPPTWHVNNFALTYKFNPDANDDGVTCAIPLGALAGLAARDFAWLVTGLLGEKVALLLRTLPRGLRREIQPISETVEKILPALQKIDRVKNDFLTALANTTWQITGVKITPDDFREEEIPAFLRMNFRIVDERGQTVNSGRDLTALQNECAQSAKIVFVQAPKNKFERDKITTWDFDFPPTVRLSGGAIGYPALQDNGENVTLLLFDTLERAEKISRRGICRLLLLGLGAQVDKTNRSLLMSKTAQQYFASIGGDNAKMRSDLLLVSARQLLDLPTPKIPRNRGEFTVLLDLAKREFYNVAISLSKNISDALELAHELHAEIFAAITPARKISFSDMQAQFTALVNPQLVNNAGAKYLPRLPRYLSAIKIRLEKLATNLLRDQKRTIELSPYWEKCAEAFATARKNNLAPPEKIRELRWLLEEYRITLFAQELGTFETVSKEKLTSLIC